MAVKNNEILIGSKETPLLPLDNGSILSINGNLACDLLCEELPIDTLEIQCRYDRISMAFSPSDRGLMRTADGKTVYCRGAASAAALEIPSAAPLWYYHDGSYMGKFYVTDAKRTGKTVYTITAKSAIGILDGMTFYGRVYAADPLEDALREILLTDGVNPTQTPFLVELAENLKISDTLESITISGWIPVCSKREALHHVLFANGLNLLKSEDDAFLVARISMETSGQIDPDVEYDSGSVSAPDWVNSVDVTEHSYVLAPNTEPVTLYDNAATSQDVKTLVLFNSAPVSVDSLTVSGTLQIHSANENCAIVSGVGTLTGVPYTHTTYVVSRSNAERPDGKAVTVSDSTLINAVNSNAVADRLFDYYTSRREISAAIVSGGELCGRKYGCLTPFGDAEEAYISSMSINASAIAKADCKLIAGYTPPKNPGELSHMVALTGSGTFTVPEEVFASPNPRIRVVLIGGGDGGGGGVGGTDGPEGFVENIDDLGQPGANGKNGNPGRIMQVQIDGESLLKSYDFSCGTGGKGGGWYYHGKDPKVGASGSPTTFGTLSSDDGPIPTVGFLDSLSGDVYGGPAKDVSGIMKSGRGGGVLVEIDVVFGNTYTIIKPEPGTLIVSEHDNVYGWTLGEIRELAGGDGPVYDYKKDPDADGIFNDLYVTYSGGGGGGPVKRYDGYSSPTYDGKLKEVSGTEIRLGDGGEGAYRYKAPTPFAFSATAYGQGGIGGQGGGGGGSSGFWLRHKQGYTIVQGAPGPGGRGSYGSDGAPGIILVYY